MDSACGYPIAGVGCPIRRSPDQSLLAAPRGFSQRATSFIASRRQGIHQMPLLSSTRPAPAARTTGHRRVAIPHRPGRPATGRPRGDSAHRAWLPATSARPPRRSIPMPGARPRRRTELSTNADCPRTTASPPHDGHRTASPHAAPRGHPTRPSELRPAGVPFGTAGPDPGRDGRPPAGAGLVGPGRLERPTSRLSGVRSNQLSYRPEASPTHRTPTGVAAGLTGRTGSRTERTCRRRAAGLYAPRGRGLRGDLRKEVIQPQVPLRLPCYDFTPVADPTVDGCLRLRG